MKSRFIFILAISLVASLFTASFSAMAQNGDDIDIDVEHEFEIHGFDFKDPEFYNVWARTDLPVLQGEVERSWLWGPAANTEVFEEPYVEATDGMREVQYSDKSRMEMPVTGSDAAADDDNSPWAITQGLLAKELMTGELQVGDDTFIPYPPAEIPVAGDWENNDGPTYADMAVYINWGARDAGRIITQAFNDAGVVGDDQHYAQYGVTDEYYISETDHNIASVFWDFMQSEGLIYDNGDLETGPIFLDEFYAIGFPLTEAYWGEFELRGETHDILVQCFERRCLTYAPANAPEWQVESGNVGLHYHEWRYNIIDMPITPEPEPDLNLVLEQDLDANIVGTEHTFTAALTDLNTDDAVDFESDDVEITITRGTDTVNPSDLTVDDVDAGVATMTYTGPSSPAVDEIDVSVEVDGTAVVGEPTLTKTWQEYEDFYECDAVVEDGESIQAAINDSSDGDTICVMEGTYSEALNITGSDNLTLLGEGSGLVTIDASAESGYGIDGSYGSTDSGSDITLQGFTLYGPRQGTEEQNFGLKLSDIDGLWIEDVHVFESRRTGIDLLRTTDVTMLNVESHDNDANGIAIRDSSVVSVDNASTSGNGWGGLALYAPGAEAVDDVEIVNSSFADEGAGVYLQQSDHTNIRILDSTFTGNGVGLGFGTEAGEAPDVDVLGNIFTNNTAAIGVAADVNVSNIVINNNSIAGNDDGVVNNGTGMLDATENWWGDPDGPTHTTNPGGSGDSVSDDVDFSDWLTSDPF